MKSTVGQLVVSGGKCDKDKYVGGMFTEVGRSIKDGVWGG